MNNTTSTTANLKINYTTSHGERLTKGTAYPASIDAAGRIIEITTPAGNRVTFAAPSEAEMIPVYVCRLTGKFCSDGRAYTSCGTVVNPVGYCCECGAEHGRECIEGISDEDWQCIETHRAEWDAKHPQTAPHAPAEPPTEFNQCETCRAYNVRSESLLSFYTSPDDDHTSASFYGEAVTAAQEGEDDEGRAVCGVCGAQLDTNEWHSPPASTFGTAPHARPQTPPQAPTETPEDEEGDPELNAAARGFIALCKQASTPTLTAQQFDNCAAKCEELLREARKAHSLQLRTVATMKIISTDTATEARNRFKQHRHHLRDARNIVKSEQNVGASLTGEARHLRQVAAQAQYRTAISHIEAATAILNYAQIAAERALIEDDPETVTRAAELYNELRASETRQELPRLYRYSVQLDGQEVEAVYHTSTDADEVRRGLIEHDGYDEAIKVIRPEDDRTPAELREAADRCHPSQVATELRERAARIEKTIHHVYNAQGFCIYCHNTHRTDFKPNEVCPFLSRKAQAQGETTASAAAKAEQIISSTLAELLEFAGNGRAAEDQETRESLAIKTQNARILANGLAYAIAAR